MMRTVFQRAPMRLAALGIFAAVALGFAVPATALAAQSANTKCADVQCVIQFGDAAISNRLTSLSTLNSKAASELSAGHITSAQAGVIEGDATNDTNGLNALKTKLDAETDISAARQDVLSIYTTYRVYAVVLPRDYRELALNIMVGIDGKLRNPDLVGKIQYAINHAPASEQGQLNALFSDYKAQLSEGESMIDAAQGQIATLTPQNFDNDRSVYDSAFTSYKNDEQTAHSSIKKAAQDLHQIAQILKSNASATQATPAS